VSLTTLPCKIKESIIKDEILQFLQDKDWMSKQQHEFVSRRHLKRYLMKSYFENQVTGMMRRICAIGLERPLVDRPEDKGKGRKEQFGTGGSTEWDTVRLDAWVHPVSDLCK
jgi:hypothetical protein